MTTDTTVRDRVRRIVGGIERHWLGLWTVLIFAFLYAPIVVIVVFSFEKGTFSTIPWNGFTLQWYQELLDTPGALRALQNSIYVGVIVTTVATVLGTLGAIALVRHEFRLKRAYRILIVAPMTVPGLILGVALLVWFNYLEITTSLRTVIIGQLVFVTPFVVITVSSRMRGFDPRFEEAARDLGASKWTTYRRITLPILMPGIISGALFAFTLSFDDFLIAFFTSGAQNTLPIWIFSTISRGITPVINAISTIALVISMLLIVLSILVQEWL